MITLSYTHTSVGRTALDEWSTRLRRHYMTIHNTHKWYTSMPPAEFEPTIPANERPQIHALDGAAAGIGNLWRSRVRKRCGRLIWTVLNVHTPFSLHCHHNFSFFTLCNSVAIKIFSYVENILEWYLPTLPPAPPQVIFAHLAPSPTPKLRLWF